MKSNIPQRKVGTSAGSSGSYTAIGRKQTTSAADPALLNAIGRVVDGASGLKAGGGSSIAPSRALVISSASSASGAAGAMGSLTFDGSSSSSLASVAEGSSSLVASEREAMAQAHRQRMAELDGIRKLLETRASEVETAHRALEREKRKLHGEYEAKIGDLSDAKQRLERQVARLESKEAQLKGEWARFETEKIAAVAEAESHLVQLAHTLAAGSGLTTNALLTNGDLGISPVSPSATKVSSTASTKGAGKDQNANSAATLDDASVEKILITITATVPPSSKQQQQIMDGGVGGIVATASSIPSPPSSKTKSAAGAGATTADAASSGDANADGAIAQSLNAPSSSILEEARIKASLSLLNRRNAHLSAAVMALKVRHDAVSEREKAVTERESTLVLLMDRIDTLHTREATLRQSVEIMQAVAEAAGLDPSPWVTAVETSAAAAAAASAASSGARAPFSGSAASLSIENPSIAQSEGRWRSNLRGYSPSPLRIRSLSPVPVIAVTSNDGPSSSSSSSSSSSITSTRSARKKGGSVQRPLEQVAAVAARLGLRSPLSSLLTSPVVDSILTGKIDFYAWGGGGAGNGEDRQQEEEEEEQTTNAAAATAGSNASSLSVLSPAIAVASSHPSHSRAVEGRLGGDILLLSPSAASSNTTNLSVATDNANSDILSVASASKRHPRTPRVDASAAVRDSVALSDALKLLTELSSPNSAMLFEGGGRAADSQQQDQLLSSPNGAKEDGLDQPEASTSSSSSSSPIRASTVSMTRSLLLLASPQAPPSIKRTTSAFDDATAFHASSSSSSSDDDNTSHPARPEIATSQEMDDLAAFAASSAKLAVGFDTSTDGSIAKETVGSSVRSPSSAPMVLGALSPYRQQAGSANSNSASAGGNNTSTTTIMLQRRVRMAMKEQRIDERDALIAAREAALLRRLGLWIEAQKRETQRISAMRSKAAGAAAAVAASAKLEVQRLQAEAIAAADAESHALEGVRQANMLAQATLEVTRTDLEEARRELEARALSVEEAEMALGERTAAWSKKMEEAEKAHSVASELASARDAALVTLRADVEAMRQNLTAGESRLEAENNKLASERSAWEALRNEMEARFAQERSALQEGSLELSALVASTTSRVEKMTEEHKRLAVAEAEVEAKRAEVAGLQTSSKAAAAALQREQEAHANFVRGREAEDKALAEERRSIEKLTAETSFLRAQLEKASAKLARDQADLLAERALASKAHTAAAEAQRDAEASAASLASRLAVFAQEKAQFDEQSSAMRSELQKAVEDCSNARSYAEEAIASAAEHKRTAEDLRARLSKEESDFATLSATATDSAHARGMAEGALKALEQQLSLARMSEASLKAELAAELQRSAAASADAEELRLALSSSEKQWQENIQGINAATEKSRSAVEAVIGDFVTQKAQLEERASKAEESAASLSSTCYNLQDKLQQAATLIGTLNDTVQSLAEQREASKQDAASLQQSMGLAAETASLQAKAAEEKVQSLESRIASLQLEIEKRSAAAAAAASAAAALNDEKAAYAPALERVSHLEFSLSEKEAELAASILSVRQAQEALAAEKSRLTASAAEVDRLVTANQQLLQERVATSSTISATADKASHLEVRVQETEALAVAARNRYEDEVRALQAANQASLVAVQQRHEVQLQQTRDAANREVERLALALSTAAAEKTFLEERVAAANAAATAAAAAAPASPRKALDEAAAAAEAKRTKEHEIAAGVIAALKARIASLEGDAAARSSSSSPLKAQAATTSTSTMTTGLASPTASAHSTSNSSTFTDPVSTQTRESQTSNPQRDATSMSGASYLSMNSLATQTTNSSSLSSTETAAATASALTDSSPSSSRKVMTAVTSLSPPPVSSATSASAAATAALNEGVAEQVQQFPSQNNIHSPPRKGPASHSDSSLTPTSVVVTPSPLPRNQANERRDSEQQSEEGTDTPLFVKNIDDQFDALGRRSMRLLLSPDEWDKVEARGAPLQTAGASYSLVSDGTSSSESTSSSGSSASSSNSSASASSSVLSASASAQQQQQKVVMPPTPFDSPPFVPTGSFQSQRPPPTPFDSPPPVLHFSNAAMTPSAASPRSSTKVIAGSLSLSPASDAGFDDTLSPATPASRVGTGREDAYAASPVVIESRSALSSTEGGGVVDGTNSHYSSASASSSSSASSASFSSPITSPATYSLDLIQQIVMGDKEPSEVERVAKSVNQIAAFVEVAATREALMTPMGFNRSRASSYAAGSAGGGGGGESFSNSSSSSSSAAVGSTDDNASNDKPRLLLTPSSFSTTASALSSVALPLSPETLLRCGICSRTFPPDDFLRHKENCRNAAVETKGSHSSGSMFSPIPPFAVPPSSSLLAAAAAAATSADSAAMEAESASSSRSSSISSLGSMLARPFKKSSPSASAAAGRPPSNSFSSTLGTVIKALPRRFSFVSTAAPPSPGNFDEMRREEQESRSRAGSLQELRLKSTAGAGTAGGGATTTTTSSNSSSSGDRSTTKDAPEDFGF